MDVGVVINKYKVVEHIGRGGMADVWSARDMQLNRTVAIKTIAHGLSQDVDPVSLFKGEAQTIAQMEHPHILPIYDFGEFEGQLYIVMRYVSGGSLEDLLSRGPLLLEEGLRMGQAIAQALDYAHSNNIIHLDLKPPNVLLDSHHVPYLADFGLATKLNPEGKANNPGSGTLLYMAPEQLTAEVIDHRADLYSFGVMMFHVLTGQLPFGGSMPLALKQLQFHEDLPDLDEVNPDIPPPFTAILRKATAMNPDERPATLSVVVDELREALMNSTAFAFLREGGLRLEVTDTSETYRLITESLPANVDAGVLEAVDIYSRALHNWSGGNGRFLLGVTHFMLMHDYYRYAEQHGLTVDRFGKQLLLRGALEYDVEVNYWWDQLDDDDRRWVCLHALRSGSSPARVRSLYRLETLPDASVPQIPKLVAQALQIETDQQAKIAALQVLGTRAKLLKPGQYDIRTDFRGRLLTTMTRIGVQLSPPRDWVEVVYTPEIDLLIAEMVFDYTMQEVADFAARIVGRMRSATAVRYIVEQRREGRSGALRALALIRDEAPSLPPGVNLQGRLYAWSANTLRRMFDRPMGIVWRYVGAVLGGWAAMFMYIWTVYRSEQLFTAARWGSSIAIGLVFAVFFAFTVLLSGEFSSRLQKFWPWWGRALLSAAAGFFLGTIAWSQYTWFYLNYTPAQDVMRFGGAGLVFGFVVTALFNLRSYIAVPLTALATYIPILLTWKYYWNYKPELPFTQVPILYFDNPDHVFTLAIPFVILIAIGGHLPSVVRDSVVGVKYLLKKWSESHQLKPAEEVYIAPVVPDVHKYAADVKPAEAAKPKQPVPVMSLSMMKTEIDMNLGLQEPLVTPHTEPNVAAALDIKTELDLSQGARVAAPPSEMKSKRITLGKKEEADEPPKTEIDVQGARVAVPPSELKSRRITLGKQENADEPPRTELDVNLGKGVVAAPPSELKSKRISLGELGKPDEPPKTEIDIARRTHTTPVAEPEFDAEEGLIADTLIGKERDTKEMPVIRTPQFYEGEKAAQNVEETTPTREEEKPITQSKRVNIGTGIKITPSDSSNMKTDLDVRKNLPDDKSDEQNT